jgi:hypothetical protein
MPHSLPGYANRDASYLFRCAVDFVEHEKCWAEMECVFFSPRAAVLKGPIYQVDGVFRLDVTYLEDKI